MKLGVEKVTAIKGPLDEKWDYFVDADGDVARARSRDLERGLTPEAEKVAHVGIKREPGFAYFVEESGDIVRGPVPRDRTFLCGHNLEELRDCASYFEAAENRYWVIKGKRARNDLRIMLGPRRLQQWVTARPPKGWLPGDRLLFWEAAPQSRIVGAGEIVWVPEEPEDDGEYVFNVSYFTPYVEGGPTADELRADRLFRDASFLKAGPGGTLFPLTEAQGKALANRVAALHAPLARHWPDAIGLETVRWKPVPLFEKCMFHLLHTDRLEALARQGGGSETIKGSWTTASRYLEDARRQKQRLLVLFDHAEYFVNPEYAGLVRKIEIARGADGKATTQVTFDHFQKLPRKYLYSKLRKASDGKYVSPGYQRGALPCETPLAFLRGGLPEGRAGGLGSVAVEQPESADARPRGNGAGFGDAETNHEVELAAVRVVTEHYRNKGWSVKSVERDRVGFDLQCTRPGSEEHAEVKGVAGAELIFMLTAGEVERAKHDPVYVVHVVTEALSTSPRHRIWRGPEFLRSFAVEPTQFRARLIARP